MLIIAGLGNPGAKYASNRHNIGFMAADVIHTRHRFPAWRKNFQAEVSEGTIDGERVLLMKPQTYMNESGRSVGDAVRFLRLAPSDVVVIHDELDLPPGTARLKFDGGHGGQNGLRDTIQHLGHGKFHRLRIGIGHPGHKDRVTSWVLGKPGKDDEILIARAIDDALDVLPLAVSGNFMDAMTRLHTPKA